MTLLAQGPAPLGLVGLVAGLLVGGALCLAVTEGGLAEIPIHATLMANGNGWRCDTGYREMGAGCVAGAPAPSRSAGHPEAASPHGHEGDAVREESLKGMIDGLSLENAVLRSQLEDEVEDSP